MKRAVDIVISFAVLLVLAPVLSLVALAIWVSDGRSPFYRGARLARGGGEFRMLKFRTMIVDAAKSGVNSTAEGDRRITRVGRVLRAFKVDELPQFWNVLKGEMSLVGPRPQVRADAELYTSEEQRMLTARPGITDLASIVFADEGAILAGAHDPDLLYNQIIRPWKSRLALLYLDQASVALDVRIIALTAIGLISRRRALDGVERILRRWSADPVLIRMAARREALLAWPPPGAEETVRAYGAAS